MASLLREVCSLKVTVQDDAIPLGRLVLEGVIRTMRRSSIVVVLAGAGKVSARMKSYLAHAAKRPSTVTLPAGGRHVPEMLKTHRSMECPQEVLKVKLQSSERAAADNRSADVEFPPAVLNAVYEIFSFLVDIQS
jgi:hypothetical protein